MASKASITGGPPTSGAVGGRPTPPIGPVEQAGSELASIRAAVRRRVGEERFARYFADARALHLGVSPDNGSPELVVSMPSPMMAALVRKHMLADLREAFCGCTRRTDATVRFEVRGQLVPVPAPEPAPAPRAAPVVASPVARRMARVARRPATLPLGLRYRLSEMIVGVGNRLAHGAASAMVSELSRGAAPQADAPAPDGPAPLAVLYVHGRCGVGKTHLLQGAAAEAFAAQAGRAVRYVNAEAFATEFITAVRNKAMDGFRRTYRYLDLLCIDDLGGLASKPATQAELQATVDAVVARGGRVMAAGPAHPRSCAGLSEGLRSRLAAGLVAEIAPADEELGERVVSAMAGRRGLLLGEGVARALVRRVVDAGGAGAGGRVSVRDLEGAVTKVEAVHRLLGEGGARQVGFACVERALRTAAPAGEPVSAGVAAPGEAAAVGASPLAGDGGAQRSARMVRMEQIVDEVCRALGVSREEVEARGRHVRVVLARAMSTHLARKLTTLSYPEIARALGRPNHSTVITAAQRLDGQLAANPVVDLGPGRGEEPLVSLRDRLMGAVAQPR